MKKKYAILTAFVAVVIIAVVIALAVTFTKDKKKNEPPSSDTLVTVDTGCQKIEGKTHDVTTDDGVQKKVYEFRNIPYAEPPVGQRRWKPPLPITGQSCNKIKYSDAVVECKQTFNKKVVGKEDCLILTVRTPVLPEEMKTKKLPVLFWIHGGGLWFGSSYWPGIFPDEQFSASMDVVSIAINYRLNNFGFLSLKELWINSGKDESYGNYGILDQIQALKWVQQNIDKFGGDPKQVTIYGVSGGGKAVYDLISSPLANGLFHKAIPSSGYPIAPNTTKEYANKKFRVFLNDTGCNKTTSNETVHCLLDTIDPDIIINNQPWFKYPEPNDFWWVFPKNVSKNVFPIDIIDNFVIPETISRITETSNPGLEILVGSMAEEAHFLVNASTWNGMDDYLKPRVDTFKTGIYDQLINMYKERRNDKTSPENITSQYLYNIISSDALASCQTNDFAKHLSSLPNTTVYRYVVSQTEATMANPTFYSAFHGIDAVALFGNTAPGLIENPNNRYLKLNLRRVFRQFIHSEISQAYKAETIEFWNNTVVTWNHPYHEKECKFMKDNGLLIKSWGQADTTMYGN